MDNPLLFSHPYTKQNISKWLLISVFALIYLLFSFKAVHAADIRISGSREGTAIYINGELMPGDGDRFSVLTNSVNNAKVFLNSEGGNLFSGLQIGTVIRSKKFSTIVQPNDICASACGLIWLAGSPRYLSEKSKLGFHSAYQVIDGKASESGVGNALVGAYLSRLGASDEAIVFFTLANPDQINWLSPQIAKNLSINFIDLDSGRSYNIPANRQKSVAANRGVLSSSELLAYNLVVDYFNFMMKDRVTARYFLQTTLKNEVIVNNQFQSRSQVISARVDDFFRLKSRAFDINPESLQIYCEKNSSCEVSGTFTWGGFSSSYETGTGEFRFDIDLNYSSPIIFGDSVYFN